MREILFKGFREYESGTEEILINGIVKTGNWIQGKSVINAISPFDECGYVFIGGRGNMFTAIFEDDARTVISGIKGATISKVIPETICECTGLKDKNGKQIFEGDRVRFFRGKDYFTGEVYFDERSGCFGARDGNDCCLFLDYFLGKQKDDKIWVEIIGTIFDVKEDAK